MREKLTICCKWLSNLQDVQLDNYKTQMKQTNLNDASRFSEISESEYQPASVICPMCNGEYCACARVPTAGIYC